MTDFQRLDTRLPQKTSQVTAEDRYWKSFKNPVVHKHFIKVTDVQFSPIAPHDIAACASTRVTIYDPLTLQPTRTLSRFKDVALSVSYRPDGRLLSSSSHDGVIQTFDTATRMILRTYTGHVGPVWSVCHSKSFASLLSAGDDLTVRLWDVSSQAEVASYTGHRDYVRTVREDPDSLHLLVSAAYDGTVKGWDRRLKPSDACTYTLQHGAPVNALALIPSSAASSSLSLISAGDVSLKAWDLRYVSSSTPVIAPVRELSSHQKAITALALDPAHTRLLSASLDGFVKVTHLPDLQPLSSLKVGAPILALALSPDATVLAVGMADGTLTLKQRPAPPLPPAPRPLPRMGSHAWFNRGAHSSPSPLTPHDSAHAPRRPALQAYDTYLKRFQYHAALDAALRTNRAVVIGAMLEELIDRGGLQVAVGGRDEEGMKGLLGWLLMYVSHPGYMGVALDVMGVVLKVYGGVVGESRLMDEWVRRVEEKVKDEVAVMERMMTMRGAMELLWRGTERLAPTQPAPPQTSEGAEDEVAADDSPEPQGERREGEGVRIEEMKEEVGGDGEDERPLVARVDKEERVGHRRRKAKEEEEEESKEGEEANMETEGVHVGEEAEAKEAVKTKRKKKTKRMSAVTAEEEMKETVEPASALKRKSKAKKIRHSIA